MQNLILIHCNQKTKRIANIDFIRIIGMIAIVICHILYHGKALEKYKQYSQLELLNISCMWHVCSFGLISGLVGVNSHKFSNLLYLWIMVVFYSFLFHFIFNNLVTSVVKISLISNIFPVINYKYWYFTAYFGCYPFLPFVNTGILSLSQIQVKKSIYFILGIFIIWSYYHIDVFQQNNGRSPLSLLMFYIFGSYIYKYIFFRKNAKNIRILIIIILFLIYIIITYFCYHISIKNSFNESHAKFKNIFRPSINSLTMILQACSITICVGQIKFNNTISKIITFIGPLTFDVYLIHENFYINYYFIQKSFIDSSIDLNLSTIFFLVFKKTIIIFIICIFIAYIRTYIFKILKIKNICIKLDRINTKIIHFLI